MNAGCDGDGWTDAVTAEAGLAQPAEKPRVYTEEEENDNDDDDSEGGGGGGREICLEGQ